MFKIKSLCVLLGIAIISNSVLAHAPRANMTEKQKNALKGIFEDADVENRSLSDWRGEWQSLYPYFLSGELDPVFQQREKEDKDKRSFAAIKAEYAKGYATNVEKIKIKDGVMEFTTDGKTASCNYEYNGFKILTYSPKERGVRYLFECKEGASAAPKYVQFSDHMIGPQRADSFHLYMGNTSHEALLKELENWPTYYPARYKAKRIVKEMLEHE